jgi:DNA-binding winged helix-turn-helix (wHTH) protein/tetratricopeptide (TPR) repeat protein/TolB-like protein
MQSNVPAPPVFRFGQFEADVARGTLSRNGLRVKLAEQPFLTLIILLEHAGETVTREELREKLWPQGVFVDFDGSLNVIAKKIRQALDDDSANPRFIETIPRHGYRFIAPVASTPSSVDRTADILPRNGGPPHQNPDRAVPPPTMGAAVASRPDAIRAGPPASTSHPRRGTYLSIAVIALGIVLLAGLYLHDSPRRTSPEKRVTTAALAQTAPTRRSVAVLDFHNLSADASDAWLGPALTEMLRTELASGEKLRMVSGEDVSSLHASSPWSLTDTLNAQTTARLGSALHTDVLVLGSYVRIARRDGNQLRLDARMQEAKTGDILAEVAEVGSDRDLFQLVSRMGNRLRSHLGAGTSDTGLSPVPELPADAETARLYTLGLAKLREFDASSAKELLQQAVEADPKFPLAHAMLARAWGQLGYEQNRRKEAKKALDLSSQLPRMYRLQIQGDYYETLADHEKAASAYRALFSLFPDSVDYGLQLAAAEMEGQHSGEARETLAQLRRLPPQSSDDPRIDLAEAITEHNIPKQLALLRSAMNKAQAQGEKLLYARARKRECVALVFGDNPQSGRPACEEAYRIYLAAGNRLEAADSLRAIGDAEGTAGHMNDAIATYQQALGILQNLGEHEKTGAILNNMAINYENQGDIDRAELLYRQAKQNFDQAGNAINSATARNNIADILFTKGNLPAAKAGYLQTLNAPVAEDPSELGYPNYRLASLLLLQGYLQDARRHAERGIEDLRPNQSNYPYLTEAMAVRGDVLLAAADVDGARRAYNEALEIRQKLGANGLIAETRLSLAALALEENRPTDAEDLAQQAIPEFDSENAAGTACSARQLLAAALVKQGKFDEARTALHRAQELRGSHPDPLLRLSGVIEQARLDLAVAKHDHSAATAQTSLATRLRAAIREAHRLGYWQTECEARLLLAETEAAAGRPNAQGDLAALEEQAHARGYELTTRKARLLQASLH